MFHEQVSEQIAASAQKSSLVEHKLRMLVKGYITLQP